MSMVKLLAFCLATAALLLGSCATTPSPPVPELDAAETQFAQDFGALVAEVRQLFPEVPGLSIAVARSDGPIYVSAVGRADVAGGIPATPDTRFYIASSTKSYVALALALLDSRGEIDLDWTLAELAPGVRFDPGIRASEVTLRHMLSHTHGFESDGIADRLAYTGQHDPATLWRLLGTLRPNREAPLGTFHYGNIGYNVATLLIERRLGRSWQQMLETEVLRPLGLRQTFARGTAAVRARGLIAAPYNSLMPEGPVRLYLQKDDDIMQSAGGMFSSAHDMARWLQLNLAAAAGRTTPVAREVVAATHQPLSSFADRYEMFERTGYGLGWYSGPLGGETLYHSFGGYTGARSHVSFMPARDVGVAILSNDEGVGSILTDLLAIYTYEWFGRGPQAARQTIQPLLDRLVAEAPRQRARIAGAIADRASRRWQLSLPRSAYTGRFCNDELGAITIIDNGERLGMTMGRLRADFEPYTEPETVRMEPISGRGRTLRFILEDRRVTALEAFDGRFGRCG
jgi:CubicO group peptidase (beta-lactamase class C family)